MFFKIMLIFKINIVIKNTYITLALDKEAALSAAWAQLGGAKEC